FGLAAREGHALAVDEVAEGLRCALHLVSPLLWGLYSRSRLCIAMVIRRLKVDYSRTAPAPAPAVESPSASATAGCMISPSCTFRPARRPALTSSAASIPRSASSITYGSVALERAWVEVVGTPPGMLVTQ